MKSLTALLLMLALAPLVQAEEIKPKLDVTGKKAWVWNDPMLRPKFGKGTAWLFDGKQLKPSTGGDPAKIYTWDGTNLTPLRAGDLDNSFTLSEDKIESKSFRASLTWTRKDNEWKPRSSPILQNTWVVENPDDVPLPVLAAVLLNLAGDDRD